MTLVIERQLALAADDRSLPSERDMQRAASAAFNAAHRYGTSIARPHTITIRIADRDESRRLNKDWRGANKPTNVLAFPAPPALISDGDELPTAGDLVICADVVAREAREQDKPADMHWAHMVIHGCLHLMGYDHMEGDQAELMERIERDAMQRLGFTDPYL